MLYVTSMSTQKDSEKSLDELAVVGKPHVAAVRGPHGAKDTR